MHTKLAVTALSAVALSIGLAPSAAGHTLPDGCDSPGWQSATIFPEKDRNGDGITCWKTNGGGGTIIKDNHVHSH